jgi:hypothetical protein
MSHRTIPLVLLAVLSLPLALAAQTSYPMLMSLQPVAVQVGQSAEIAINSRYSMHGTYQVSVTGQGVTGEVVTPMELKPGEKAPNLQKITVRFTVAADATPGVRDVRLAGPTGASTLGQLVVVRDPVVSEAAKNDTIAQAQPITVPATVCGRIERVEDVDFFQFTAKAGQRLVFHVRCMRLQDRIHDLQTHADPIISLRNASGTTVATADNHFAADPLLGHTFTEAGNYFLEVRDVRYQGNTYWEYAIEIGERPFAQTVHPLGIAAGQTTTGAPVGVHVPDGATADIKAPAAGGTGIIALPLSIADQAIGPVQAVVTDLPLAIESASENNAPETAQAISAPGAVSGRIESEAYVDCFSFTAKKGQRFTFEVIAERAGSELDSNLRVLEADPKKPKGRQLAENDDMRLFRRGFSDSLVEFWAAPADGTYAVEVRDLHLRGGAAYTYFLQITPAEPTFELYLDTDKTQVAPGTCGVLFVNAVRKNGFAGEIELAVEGLPEGITAHCGRILADRGEGCIIFEPSEAVSAGVEMSMANVLVTGTAQVKRGDAEQSLSIPAVPYQETYQPGGGRGHWPVDVHTVAVSAPMDVRAVTLSTQEVTLKPGESQRIDVTIERAPGFDKNVQLDLMMQHLNRPFADPLPKGVTIDAKSSKTLLTAGATQGHITLTCAADAKPVERQQVAVMANVSLNFVMKATYGSQPLFVTVSAP